MGDAVHRDTGTVALNNKGTVHESAYWQSLPPQIEPSHVKAPPQRTSLSNSQRGVAGTPPTLDGRVTLTPVKDNSIYSGYQNNSNGPRRLYVGLNNDGNNIKRTLLDFDVAGGVPAGATINSVTLTMYCYRNQNGATTTVELHKLLADWGEGTSAQATSGRARPGHGGHDQRRHLAADLLQHQRLLGNPGRRFLADHQRLDVGHRPRRHRLLHVGLHHANGGRRSKLAEQSRHELRLAPEGRRDPEFVTRLRFARGGNCRPTAHADDRLYRGGAAPTLAIAATDASKAEGNSGSTAFTFTVTRSGDTSGTSHRQLRGHRQRHQCGRRGRLRRRHAAQRQRDLRRRRDLQGDHRQRQWRHHGRAGRRLHGHPLQSVGGTITHGRGHRHDHSTTIRAASHAGHCGHRRQQGGRQLRQHGVHLHRDPQRRHQRRIDRQLRGHRQRHECGRRGRLRRRHAPSGSVTSPPARPRKVITVNVNGDTTVEPDEGFTVTLSSPVGATITTAAATGTIPTTIRRSHAGHCGHRRQQGGRQLRQHGVHLHRDPQRRHQRRVDASTTRSPAAAPMRPTRPTSPAARCPAAA